MKPLLLTASGIFWAVGFWLAFWNPIKWLTAGLDYGIWDNSVLISGFPSIATGVVMLVITSVLGYHAIVN